MGFTSPSPESQREGANDPAGTVPHQSFGDKLGDFAKSSSPLINALFGDHAQPQAAVSTTAMAPLAVMPDQPPPDFSLVNQNAQIPKSDKMSLIKMLFGG